MSAFPDIDGKRPSASWPRRMILDAVRLFDQAIWRRASRLYWRATMPRLGALGAGSVIERPFYSGNEHLIRIGHGCHIGRESDLGVVDDCDPGGIRHRGNILLGDRVWITKGLQVYSATSVEIQDDAMLAANVFICDYSHGIRDIGLPFKDQVYERISPIVLGKGCWIGQNCVILPGVNIGAYSVVGANSVVTHSIPARCIALGAPARVVSRWSNETSSWIKEG